MKVLHVTNLYPFEDAPTYGIFVKEQIDSLNNKNYQDVFFINARSRGFKEYLRVIKELKDILKNYDLIHCHHQFSAVSVYLANPKKKIIVSILGDIEKRNILNKVIYRYIKKHSEKIIYKNKIPNDSKKNILLPNGVNLNFFKPNNQSESRKVLNLNKKTIYILFVSNGDLENPIKRYDKFLKVFNLLVESEERIKYEILNLNNVKREKVPHYYNAANLMIVTSDHEGSPNAVKEAMACNLPIISTSVGDVPFLLENVENSAVSLTGTEQELYNLTQKIDFSLRSNGREKLTDKKLDSENIAKKLINIYRETIAS